MSRAFGIDISKYNTSADGTKKVNFDAIKKHEEEVVFIAARAGVSWGYEDPQFKYYWEEMQRIQRCRIAYHVIYFGESALSQMDNLFKILGNNVNWEHDAIALDLEVAGINTRERITTTTQKCLSIAKARTGRYPICYSRANWVDTYLSIDELPTVDWWLAQYRTALPYPFYTPEHPGPPILPKRAKTWLMHQTGDKGKGIGTPGAYYMDYNRWNGDKGVVYKYFGYKEEPPPAPVLDPPLFRAKCITTALNKRSGPGTSYSIVGALLLGDVVEVFEEKDGWFKIERNANVWCSGNPKYMEKINDDPPPTGAPLFQAKCIVNALNKRSGPGTSNPVIGYLLKDEVVDVYKEKEGWYKISNEKQVWCSGHAQYMEKVK